MGNKICNKCSATLTDEQKFCPYCGTEYKKPMPVCQKCGVVLEEGQKFCHRCGEKNENRCINCGAELTQNNRYCSNCGEQVKKSSFVKEKIEKIRQDKMLTVSLLKRGVVLLLAFVMLISIFLPFTKALYTYETYIKFSPVENIVVLFDMLIEYEKDEYKESALYKRTERLHEKVKEKYGENREDAYGTSLYSRYLKNDYRLIIRKSDIALTAGMIINAIMNFAYIVFVIIFFILALLSFLSLFINTPDYTEKTDIAFTFAPIMIVLTTLFKLLNNVCALPIILIVLSVISLVAFVFYRHLIEEKKSIDKRSIVKNCLSIACCILVLLVSVIPLFRVTATTKFSKSDKEETASAGVKCSLFTEFDYYATADDEIMVYYDPDSQAKNDFDSLSLITKSEFKKGDAAIPYITKNIIVGSTIDYTGIKASWIFSSGYYFTLLTVVSSVFLLWNKILSAVCDISLNKGILKGTKVTLLISTLIVFALVLAISISSTIGCQNLNLDFKTSISIGMIVILIASVIVAIEPIENRS